MKYRKIALLFVAVTFLLGLYSCKKDSFNINQDPNNATDSTVAYNVILPAALNNTARVVSRNWAWLQNYLGYWARSGTYAPNTEEETYEITTNFQAGIWSGMYDNLYDYQVMENGANKAGASFYEGIAKIMKAHNYGILVSIYNNVPYSEALKGASIKTPKYDDGLSIYKDLLRQLDVAIELIKNADESETGPNANVLTDDIMFGTQLFPSTSMEEQKVRWVQFANTLKLRILTKFMNGGLESNTAGTVGTPASYVPGVDLQAEFALIQAEGTGFLDFDAEVQPGYLSDKGNPFYNLYVADDAGSATSGSVYYKANSYAVGSIDGTTPGYYGYNFDPRKFLLYSANASNKYKGVDYGAPSSTDNAASMLSGIGSGLYRGVDQPQWILTAAESYFLQAECMNREFLAGDAAATLNSGIAASIISLGGDAVDVDDYIVGNEGYPDVDYIATEIFADGATGGLFTIISQKWFALNGIAPFEVWSDYRRIDISSSVNHFVYGGPVEYLDGPAISVSPANTRTEIPVRLLYPQGEYLYNPVNVGAQPSAGSYPFSHIFWDLQ